MRKKICVVTGSRAEYGLFVPLLKELLSDGASNLQILVTGSHLVPEFGLTWKEIARDGFTISARVPILSRGKETDMARSIAAAIAGLSPVLRRLRPDAVILLGDRFETFAAAVAAFVVRIPIVHLHGGEITEGALDEGFRHSITKMSSLHFTSTDVYRRRVIQLGESPDRVFSVGALGLDNIRNLNLLSKAELRKALGVPFDRRTALVTFHPETLSDQPPSEQAAELLGALDDLRDLEILFTMPNADTGSRALARLFWSFVRANRSRASAFASLGRLNYLSAMKHCDVVVGNSSSGIIEAPSLGKPTVDVGGRQSGRIAARSVIHCRARRDEIIKAVRKALSRPFLRLTAEIKNPYGDGKSASRMVSILRRELPRIERSAKKFHDIAPPRQAR